MTDPQFRRPWEVDPDAIAEQKAKRMAEELETARRGLLLCATRGISLDEVIRRIDVAAIPAIARIIAKIQREASERAIARCDHAPSRSLSCS